MDIIQNVLSSIREVETEQYLGKRQLALADPLMFISLFLLDFNKIIVNK